MRCEVEASCLLECDRERDLESDFWLEGARDPAFDSGMIK
jgi:hypothetical protein